MVKLVRLSVLVSALLAIGSISMAAPLAGTTTFEPPVEITRKDVLHDFGKHAVTRLVDWDADGDDDVLIGAADGRVWLMRNLGHGRFDSLEAVTLNGQPLRLGTQSTDWSRTLPCRNDGGKRSDRASNPRQTNKELA